MYYRWTEMKRRCYVPNHPKYHRYGGRGIKVCKRWLNSFASFYADVGDPPSPAHSLDRFPNPDGDYKPGNVRWASAKQQAETNTGLIKPGQVLNQKRRRKR